MIAQWTDERRAQAMASFEDDFREELSFVGIL
jgi:hypothetical protein